MYTIYHSHIIEHSETMYTSVSCTRTTGTLTASLDTIYIYRLHFSTYKADLLLTDSSSLYAQLICYLLRGCSDCLAIGEVVGRTVVEVTLLERVWVGGDV